MKFLILLVATCMLAGINADYAATDDSAAPTLESITDEASTLFTLFGTEVLNTDIDILNNVVYAKYLEVKDKLDNTAYKLATDVVTAQANTVAEVQQIKENSLQYSDTAFDLCSYSASVDVDFYVTPEIDSGIQNELQSYQDALNTFGSKITELLDTSYIYPIYSKAVDNADATVESIQAYIASIKVLQPVYNDWAHAKAQQAVKVFDNLGAQYETRAENKSQYLQSILSSVGANLQACLSNSDRL